MNILITCYHRHEKKLISLRVELLGRGLGTCAILLDDAQLFSKVLLTYTSVRI